MVEQIVIDCYNSLDYKMFKRRQRARIEENLKDEIEEEKIFAKKLLEEERQKRRIKREKNI